MTRPNSSGLEGVIAAETAISDVDGEHGRLVIAGHDVERLAERASYETAADDVLGAGRDGARRDPRAIGAGGSTGGMRESLAHARARAWELLPRLGDALAARDAMDALRTGLAHLRASGDDERDALEAIGAAPVLMAAWSRARAGSPLVPPSLGLSHAEDTLKMTTGEMPPALIVRALDAYLVTVIDHGMNASTFTARVVASTGSDLISAVVAAVGALKGPLHGGAPGPVLDMLDAIGEPGRAEEWLRTELAAGRRIMGMGHRIYRVRDPRAAVLERASKPLASPRLELARAVEAAASKILRERRPELSLAANVEFYTAVLLDGIGLAREQFSATFAVSRIAGWCAHVIEQRRTGRLIRPASRYVGTPPG
jgi:citrate synthase